MNIIKRILYFLVDLLLGIILVAPAILIAIAYFIFVIARFLIALLDFVHAIIELDIGLILSDGLVLLITSVVAYILLRLPFFLMRRWSDYLERKHQEELQNSAIDRKSIQIKWINFTSNKRTKRTTKISIYFLLISFSIIFLFPMIWMIASSTKPDPMIYEQMGTFASFLPSFGDGFKNLIASYITVIVEYHIWKYAINSVAYAIVIVVGNVFINSLAGYALAKYDFPGKRLLFTIIIGLIIIPIETTIIPLYTIVHSLGLTGTALAVIIPPLLSVFNIFLFRQFFIGIPKELEEAARLDGASAFTIYLRVILPLSKPIIATVATFTFIGVWNDYVWPIMVLPTPSGDSWPLYPVQAALNVIQGDPYVQLNEVMASLTLTTIPLVIVYIIAQKYIVEGLGHTGIK